MREVTERRVTYQYGSKPFQGVFAGAYTWPQLTEMIKDDRWGSPYEIILKEERTVTYGDWVEYEEEN